MDTSTTTPDAPEAITNSVYVLTRSEWRLRLVNLEAQRDYNVTENTKTIAEGLDKEHNKEYIVALAKAMFPGDVVTKDTKAELCEAIGRNRAWTSHRQSKLHTEIEETRAAVRVFDRIDAARTEVMERVARLTKASARFTPDVYPTRNADTIDMIELAYQLAAAQQTAADWASVAELIVERSVTSPQVCVRRIVWKIAGELDWRDGNNLSVARSAHQRAQTNGRHRFMSEASEFMDEAP